MSATTEEEHAFSDLVTRWLDEGDRLHENPPPHHHGTHEVGRARSWRLWAAIAVVLLVAVGGRLMLQRITSTEVPQAGAALPPPPRSGPIPAFVPAAPKVAPVVAPQAEAVAEKEASPAPSAAVPPVAPAAASAVAPPAVAPEVKVAVAIPPAPAPASVTAEAPAPAVAPAPPAVEERAATPAKTVAAPPVPVAAAAPVVAAPPAPAPVAQDRPVSAPAAAPLVAAAASVPVVADRPTAAEIAPATAVPVDFDQLLQSCRDATAHGRWGVARTACAAAQQVRPDSPDVLTRLAEIALNKGQGRQALRLASAALAADPAFADAYVIVGSVEQESNRVDKARAAYTRYLQLAPSGRYASDLRAILATL